MTRTSPVVPDSSAANVSAVLRAWGERFEAEAGDILFILSGETDKTRKQLNELRDALRTMISGIDETESSLAKVKLANKLGCTVDDLATEIVECPKDKLGSVIGKNGATMKQICETTKVTMDVMGNKEKESGDGFTNTA